jgi:hypothetical protein
VECEQRPLKVKPPEEVFDIVGRKRQVDRQMELDAFVNKLQYGLNTTTEQTMDNTIENLDISNEVRELVKHYLELGV